MIDWMTDWMTNWEHFFYYVMLLAAAEWFGHVIKTLFQIYRERLKRFQEEANGSVGNKID